MVSGLGTIALNVVPQKNIHLKINKIKILKQSSPKLLDLRGS